MDRCHILVYYNVQQKLEVVKILFDMCHILVYNKVYQKLEVVRILLDSCQILVYCKVYQKLEVVRTLLDRCHILVTEKTIMAGTEHQESCSKVWPSCVHYSKNQRLDLFFENKCD